MADGTGFLNRGNNGHIAERRERVGRALILRVHTIVVGYKNSGHWNDRSYRDFAVVTR